ncbi:hypothetical protein E2C01_066265 [Portunus trituberculatus]|uniref:Uncharacterized protein n=1 Tax=Portunus trituberculatus TaxID=210409 RepID=A0A5B7HPA6_PORTR|nr:hypothetical protein [Portunus trituberculatus]
MTDSIFHNHHRRRWEETVHRYANFKNYNDDGMRIQAPPTLPCTLSPLSIDTPPLSRYDPITIRSAQQIILD